MDPRGADMRDVRRRLVAMGWIAIAAAGACTPDPGPPALPTTIVVTTTADVVDGADGLVSLREAFTQAWNDNADSTIVVSSGSEYVLNRCDLGGLQHGGIRAVVVRADAAARAVVRLDCPSGRVMTISGSSARLERLTIRGGRLASPVQCGLSVYLQPPCERGAGIDSYAPIELVDVEMTDNRSITAGSVEGGALSARQGATVTDSSFHHNTSNRLGGAIAARGALVVAGSRFESNSSGDGGAISVLDGSVAISDTLLASNTAGSGGAIVLTNATLVARDSVFRSNVAGGGPGGAIWADAGVGSLVLERVAMVQNSGRTGALTTFAGVSNFQILDSTISDNVATGNFRDQYNRMAGGIATLGAAHLTIRGSTIAHNSAMAGGGANIDLPPANGTTVSLVDSIVSNPLVSGANCQANGNTFVVSGSIVDDGTCGTSAGPSPLLGPLMNAGATWWRAPGPTSPAIDATAGPCSTATDQRHVARPQGAGCDRGAVEQ